MPGKLSTFNQKETIMICTNCKQEAASFPDDRLCEACFAEAEERRMEIIQLARQQCHVEGAVEIDDDAILSEGNDNGCYVRSWVWADFNGTKFDKETGDANE